MGDMSRAGRHSSGSEVGVGRGLCGGEHGGEQKRELAVVSNCSEMVCPPRPECQARPNAQKRGVTCCLPTLPVPPARVPCMRLDKADFNPSEPMSCVVLQLYT